MSHVQFIDVMVHTWVNIQKTFLTYCQCLIVIRPRKINMIYSVCIYGFNFVPAVSVLDMVIW